MNTRPSSIRDVAAAAGVSRSTVSLVLNDSPIPSPETRTKVMRAVEELNYRPDPVFRQAFRRRREGKLGERVKTQTLGFLMDDVIMTHARHSDGYYSLVLRGIQRSTKDARYLLMIDAASPEDTMPSPMVTENRIDGLLIEGDFPRPLLEELTRRLPVSFVDRTLPDLPANSVMPNLEEAVREQLRYLWELGHRNIATFQAALPDFRVDLYLRGFRQFFLEKDVPDPPIHQRDISPETHDEVIRDYANYFASLPDRPTALVTWSAYASPLVTAFGELGVRIPSEVSLIGMDDVMEARLTKPQLTVYRFPMDEIGRSAADLLLECIEDPSRPPRHLLVNGKLIERGTCAKPASRKAKISKKPQ